MKYTFTDLCGIQEFAAATQNLQNVNNVLAEPRLCRKKISPFLKQVNRQIPKHLTSNT